MLRFFLIFLTLSFLVPLQAQREQGRSGSSRPSNAPSVRSSSPDRSSLNQSRSATPQSVRSQRNTAIAEDRNSSRSESSRTTRNIPYAPASDRSYTPGSARTDYARPSSQQNLWTYDQSELLNQRSNTKAQTSKNAANTVVQAKGLKEVGRVQWMSIEQAIEKSKTEKRKIYIDVYTDWCGWCKHMDSTTFTNPAVVKYLNDNFYPVKFNAEQHQDISLNGKTYKFVANGSRGHHELAAHWLNNRLSFPTSVFLDENLNIIQPLPGYLEAPKLEAIINYFGTNSHRTTPWETYEKKFSSQR